jgi:REP element-mobilizing transposase RayT
MEKFRNTYRISSARLPGWDYRNAAAYFITICTQNREHFFGDCQNGKMLLTTAGMIVQGCWYQIPFLNSHVHLGAFVVMPNHVHGILILDDMGNDGENKNDNDIVEAFESNASTTKSSNDSTIINNINKNEYFQNISPKSGSVSRIIQQYKSVCTKHIRMACPTLHFEWQSRFYDHIVRHEDSFQNISNYILNNPKNWEKDKFFNT